jgi:phosphatidylserine/phosphatidylglycerophosphate/cardiolipin synthase-like enzyme
MTVDGETAVVGAANYDWRSFRLDFEVGAVIYSPVVAHTLTEQFEADLQQSTAATLEQVRSLRFWQRTLDHCARLLAPLL